MYNLKFVKISGEHQIAGVGFGGDIFIVLNVLTSINTNDKLHVDMQSNECVCTEKEMIFGTFNCWEYYFNQPQIDNQNGVIHVDSLSRTGSLNYDNQDQFMFPGNFKELGTRFFDNFKLKPYLQKMLCEYCNDNIKDKVTLGVQIRLTDMKYHHNVAPVEKYIKKINEILVSNPSIKQVFLATDDGVIIPKVRDEVVVPVLCYEDMFRSSLCNPHLNPYDRINGYREFHRYNLGVECIKDILTLSKCDYLLKADRSAMSLVAIILSENIREVYKV